MFSHQSLISLGHHSSPPSQLERPSVQDLLFTPRRLPSYLPRAEDGYTAEKMPYPSGVSTAPLPHTASFLGSPFNSKTDRGRYAYQSMSPTRPRTANIGLGDLVDQNLDWLESREWMVEERLPTSESDEEGLSMGPRRETFGSSSSIDEFSGSGTSTASLSSLNRNSGDLQRPHIVTVWSDPCLEAFEDDTNPATPSRQLFAAGHLTEDALHMSIKASKIASAGSPISARTTSTPHTATPLRRLLRSRSPQVDLSPDDSSASPLKPKRSPLSGLLPKMLSSTKSAVRQREPRRSPGHELDGEDAVATDTEDMSEMSITLLRASRKARSTKSRTVSDASATASAVDGVGLGISCTSTRSFSVSLGTKPFSAGTSLSSDSSTEVDNSPSRFASLRASDSGHPTISKPPRPTAPIVRRKSNAGLIPPSGRSSSLNKSQARPLLRRGITEPKTCHSTGCLSPDVGVHTPVHLLADVKPSPAAFASTGLVKKRSCLASVELPTFGDKLKDSRDSLTCPVKPSSSLGQPALQELIPGSEASVTYVKAAQKARGLRRKCSQMFASASSGSLSENSGTLVPTSPITPTKPGMRMTPFTSSINTPSPQRPDAVQYPFAASSGPLKRQTSVDTPGPTEDPVTSTINPKVATLRRGPVVRLSNPMLAADFKAHSKTPAQAASLHTLHSGIAPAGRLERDFLLVSSLGSGEFSQVWKAQEKSSGKLFAVKAGKPYAGSKNRLRQLEEVSILRSLSLRPHAGIVTFHDSWEARGRLYIRTELVPCGDLARYLLIMGDLGGLGEARAWKTLAELSSAIEHVHDSGFLHLDIKPSNILITSDGHLKVADFGMSTTIDDAGQVGGLSPALPQSVEDGAFVWDGSAQLVPSPIIDREIEGDREYLAPEALEGNVGREADVFSLGILLLEGVMNVVLPSNGAAWIKLRSDDFSDLDEHHTLRHATKAKEAAKAAKEDKAAMSGKSDGDGSGELPELSQILVQTIRGMMRRIPEARLTLREVGNLGVVQRVTRAMKDGRAGAALAEEGEGFLSGMMGEEA